MSGSRRSNSLNRRDLVLQDKARTTSIDRGGRKSSMVGVGPTGEEGRILDWEYSRDVPSGELGSLRIGVARQLLR